MKELPYPIENVKLTLRLEKPPHQPTSKGLELVNKKTSSARKKYELMIENISEDIWNDEQSLIDKIEELCEKDVDAGSVKLERRINNTTALWSLITSQPRTAITSLFIFSFSIINVISINKNYI